MPIQEFEDRKAHDVPVDRGHAVHLPVLCSLPDPLIYLFKVFTGAADELFGKCLDILVLLAVQSSQKRHRYFPLGR